MRGLLVLASYRGSTVSLSVIFQQVYAPGPYGDYVAPPPHATQIVYSADGQPYAVAYPYQYQGTFYINKWFVFTGLPMFLRQNMSLIIEPLQNIYFLIRKDRVINSSKFKFHHCKLK